MTLSMENAAERFNRQLAKGHVAQRDGGLWFDEDAATAITELAINLEEARDEARGLAAAVAELGTLAATLADRLEAAASWPRVRP